MSESFDDIQRGEILETQWKKSTCPYCGIGCGLNIKVENGKVVKITGLKEHPTNKGHICLIAANLHKVFDAEGRLTSSLIRKNGELMPVNWQEVISHSAQKLNNIIQTYGPNSLAFYGGAANLTEEYYLMNKLMKGAIGSNNLECSTRLCMSSSALGFVSTIGADAPPACYDDIEEADLFFIAGNNMAVTLPIIFRRVKAAKQNNKAKVIVVDPRRTPTTEIADIHLQIKPGTDVALNNAIAHVLIRDKFVDEKKINNFTSGYDDLKEFLKEYPPEKMSAITDCSEQDIIKTAHLIGNSKAMLTFWFQGYNHSSQATFKNNTLHNLSLLTNNFCRPGAGPLSITGEANALGNRWVGALSHLLPGLRLLANSRHRKEMAEFWNIPIEKINPVPGKSILDIIKGLHSGEIKALWVANTNPAASLPNTKWIEEGLKKAELLIVQDIFHPTETTMLADVVFAAAQWSEKTGTFISSDRRVQFVEQIIDPPGNAKPDYEIIWLMAREMGFEKEFPFNNPEEVFEEWKKISKGRICDMTGVSYQRLRKTYGIQLPCPDIHHQGTKRLFTDLNFPRADGRAALLSRDYIEPVEIANNEFPFNLNSGKTAAHFNTRTRTGRIKDLNNLAPEAIAHLHKEDAQSLNINNADKIVISSRRGSITVKVKISDTIRKGDVYVDFHYGKALWVGDNQLSNILINNVYDMYSKQPEFKICAVNIKKAEK